MMSGSDALPKFYLIVKAVPKPVPAPEESLREEVKAELPNVAGEHPPLPAPVEERKAEEVKEQQPLLERALPTAGVRAGVGRSAGKAIWEDVWLGYALGQLDPPPELGIVAIDWSLFFENWGIGIRPASLVWHAKVKHAGRLELLQRWSEKHHCMRRRPQNLTCHNAGRSCTGGLWRMCLETNVPSVHNCSDTQADLKYLLVRGLLNSTSST